MKEYNHVPVLLVPTLDALRVEPGGLYLDATLGLGGHGAAILARCGAEGGLVGLDRDVQALEKARIRLKEYGDRARLVHTNYARFDETAAFLKKEALSGALLDLGVSSMQLMDPERGFSFQSDGPLDMRMDLTQTETAETFLQRVMPEELERHLAAAGEERFAKKLSRILLENREALKTTGALAELVGRVLPRHGKTHPATRVFMALRLAVNREIESLNEFMRKIPMFLKPGGRLAVITFHSTEDRVVKRFYSETMGVLNLMKAVNRTPIVPDRSEVLSNPRSRSAKLRVFEKVGAGG